MIYNIIKDVIPHFFFNGVYQSGEEVHSGNINTTFHFVCADHGVPRHYLLQRVNTYVFKEPEKVMGNIARVTEHLRTRMLEDGTDPERRVLELIPTRSGALMHKDANGGYWRAYSFVTGATAYDVVSTPELFREVGRGFGSFQRYLTDFKVEDLYVSIPDFHNTKKRFFQLVRAIDEDAAGRAKQVDDEIEFMFEHRLMMNSIVQKIDSGELPLRVTHNDTKSNNVMVDDATGEAICVVDLDTVMPGSVLYDYGDAIRFGASTAAEDEPDTSKISLDLDKTRAFTEGFIKETNGFLTETELRLLPLGIKVITCELAMRFLTDYLDGDRYFKVNSPSHNLVRTHAQIALLRDIEKKESLIQDMVDNLIGQDAVHEG